MLSYILLLLGFALLIKGADWFVEGSSSIATSLKIPSLIIGLTIVAFGTSAPEAAVSITASLRGQNDMAMGNVVGSNLFNLLLVLGLATAISPIRVKKSIITKEFPFLILASLVLIILGYDTKFQGWNQNQLTMSDGLILLALLGIFVYYLIELALSSREVHPEDSKPPSMSIPKSILYALIGLAGIVLGGNFVVNSANTIAISWGMSESLAGLTIVAVGTSLPELITSIVAAKKGESDIALGNVIGSNMFNIVFILGLSAVIHPIGVADIVFVDLLLMLLATIIAYLFAVTKKTISRVEGILLVLTYIAYFVYIILRN